MRTSDLAIPPWFAILVVFFVCGSAIWKGEWEERTVAVAIIVAWPLTLVLRDPNFDHPQWGGFAVTVVNLAVFGGVALRSGKFWPLWVAGFQLLAVITHSARMLDPTLGAWAYITAGIIWTYLQFIGLAIGVWGCSRRRAFHQAGIEGEGSPAESPPEGRSGP